MNINPYATIITYCDGLAICEDDFGDLWYYEMPEEFAHPGEVLELEGLAPLSALSEQDQQRIHAVIDAIPEDELNDLRDGYEVR